MPSNMRIVFSLPRAKGTDFRGKGTDFRGKGTNFRGKGTGFLESAASSVLTSRGTRFPSAMESFMKRRG